MSYCILSICSQTYFVSYVVLYDRLDCSPIRSIVLCYTGTNVWHPPRIDCFELFWDVIVRWSRPGETATIRISSEDRPDWAAVKRVSQTGPWLFVEQVYTLEVMFWGLAGYVHSCMWVLSYTHDASS